MQLLQLSLKLHSIRLQPHALDFALQPLLLCILDPSALGIIEAQHIATAVAHTCSINAHKGAGADSSADSSRSPAAKARPTFLELIAYNRHGRVWEQLPQGKAAGIAVARVLEAAVLHDGASDRFCRDVEGHVGYQGNIGWQTAHCHQAQENGTSMQPAICNLNLQPQSAMMFCKCSANGKGGLSWVCSVCCLIL